jgi:hypothetical protein
VIDPRDQALVESTLRNALSDPQFEFAPLLPARGRVIRAWISMCASQQLFFIRNEIPSVHHHKHRRCANSASEPRV